MQEMTHLSRLCQLYRVSSDTVEYKSLHSPWVPIRIHNYYRIEDPKAGQRTVIIKQLVI